MPEPILELKNLQTYFPVHRGLVFKRPAGTVKAVDGVSLALRRGEVLGLVGESGCGKSTLARTILQLVPATAGSVVLEGRNLAAAGAAEVRASRRTAVRCPRPNRRTPRLSRPDRRRRYPSRRSRTHRRPSPR